MSSLGTNVKISVFGTRLVTRANVNKKQFQGFFKHWRKLQILSFNSFLNKTLGGRLFKKPYLFHNNARFWILYITCRYSRFRNKYDFFNKSEFRTNKQFKPKHMFIIIKNHNFLWMIKLFFKGEYEDFTWGYHHPLPWVPISTSFVDPIFSNR